MSLKNKFKFLLIIIWRDLFKPEKGNKNTLQYFFQCYLPTISSLIIGFILCLTGLISIIIWDNYSVKVENLEKNPFSSSIIVEGDLSEDIYKKLNNIYFDPSKDIFVSENIKNYIRAIKAVIPYKHDYVRLMKYGKNDEMSPTEDIFEMISLHMNINNESQKTINSNAFQITIEKNIVSWLKDNMLYKNKDIDSINKIEDIPQNGIILSKYLYDIIQPVKNQNRLKDYIHILYDKREDKLLEERKEIVEAKKDKSLYWKPLNEFEKNKYLFQTKLLNTASNLPSGDIMVSEEFMNNFQSDCFDPCRPVRFFQVIWGYNVDPNLKSNVIQWLDNEMDDFIQSKIYDDSSDGVQIEFIEKPPINKEKYYKVISECNIKQKFNQLKAKINQNLILDIIDHENENCYRNFKFYNNAFVYINDHPDIIKNIKKLVKILKYKGFYTDIHQVMTLIKYRQDIRHLRYAIYIIMCCIATLIFFYISQTTFLLMHNKMHVIGTLLSMNASSFFLFFIYIIESLILIGVPLLLSLLLLNEYIMNNYILLFSISVLLLSGFSAGITIYHIVSQSPYKLISYRV